MSLSSWNTTANSTLGTALGKTIQVWRLYAAFSMEGTGDAGEEDDRVNSVFQANIMSTNTLVNVSAQALPDGSIFGNPALLWDSFTTINATSDANGTAVAADGSGITFGANSLSGGWFLAGSQQGSAGANPDGVAGPGGTFLVLLAQLTVEVTSTPMGDQMFFSTEGFINGGGIFTGSMRLGVDVADDPVVPSEGSIPIMIPTPGALALMGLAGLTALRRRRTA